MQWIPIGIPTLCWKTRPLNVTNMLLIKQKSSLLIMSDPEIFRLVKKYDASLPKTYIFIYVDHLFLWNKTVPMHPISLVSGIHVWRIEKSNMLILLREDKLVIDTNLSTRNWRTLRVHHADRFCQIQVMLYCFIFQTVTKRTAEATN